MGDDSASFLSLFKHKSAIDPRVASTTITLDESDDEEEITPYQLGNGKLKRKRRQPASNGKRSKSDLSEKQTKSMPKSGTSQRPVTLDDGAGNGTDSPEMDATYLSNSPLPSYLADALQKVNENKRLRAQLKSSIDGEATQTPPPPAAAASNLLHPPSTRNSTAHNTTGKKAPTVYTIDSDDDENDATSRTHHSTSTTSASTTSTTTATSDATSLSNSDSSSVLFYVYSSQNDQQPLKFRYLKTEGFTKLLTAYCKFKKYDSDSAGLKWYGISLDPKQTPIYYEMTEEEKLYYYNKNGIYEASNSENTSKLSTTSNVNPPQQTTNHNATVDASNPIPNDNNTSSSSNNNNSSSSENQQQDDVIVLKLRSESVIQRFRIRVSDPFKKLCDGYAAKHQLDPNKVMLVFDGLSLTGSGTPAEYDMESDDIIDVKICK